MNCCDDFSEDEKKCIKVWGGGGCCLTVTILVIVLLATSISVIDPTEVGVEFKVVASVLGEDLLEEGRNTHTPFSEIIRWPVIYQTSENKITCNSKDGLKIDLDVSFQYIPQWEDVIELTEDYRNFDKYKNILAPIAQSSIRHTCSDFTADDFQKMRSEVHNTMEAEVKERLLSIKADLIELQLRNIDRPGAYEQSVENSEAARSDITLALNEREQQITSANTLLVEAQQTANKTIDLANTEAEITITSANIQAQTVLNWYEVRTGVYKNVMNDHEFNITELINYISNELMSESSKFISKEPSQIVY